MQCIPRFSEIPYQRPDRVILAAQAQDRNNRWDLAQGASEQIALIREWDNDQKGYDTHYSTAMVHYRQNTTRPEYKVEKEFFDDLNPTVLEHNVAFLRRVTESPHRDALAKELGTQVFALWDRFLVSFEPRIADEKRQEAKLWNAYSELLTGIRVQFAGEEHTFSTLRAFYGHADRDTRLNAQRARAAALTQHRDEFDQIYNDLVLLRHQMAQSMGYDDFIPLGYARMERTDYNADDVAQFRQNVQRTVLPLAQRIYARRARAIGVTDYSFHDEMVRDSLGVPQPDGDHDWMLARATEMFDILGEDFGAFFRMMHDREFLDLKSRPDKAGGGFCTSFPTFGIPFIFANFNGTQDDVRVFTHECGHAFQNWSAQVNTLREYQWPTAEAAEIHSMSLELLTFPMMNSFFGEDAKRYCIGHLEDAILFLPYGCAVDEFQHRVYAEPHADPARRAEMWREIEAIYLPQRTYSDMPHFASGRYWQVQRHIYGMPFYYIDYCLAQTCALQMWQTGMTDRAGTMQRYRQLCKLGGSRPFTELLHAVDLDNPFDPECLVRVCKTVGESLDLT